MDTHKDIFRLAQIEDIDEILAFTSTAREGLTNVPTTRERVTAQVEESIQTLKEEENANRLLFVVERDGVILGMSAIIMKLGGEVPFYNFKRSRHSGRATNPKLAIDYDTLQLTTDFYSYSEVASLFMAKAGRGTGLARLLSMGRFGYIQNNRDAFQDGLMAEILGWTDKDNVSPFWKHLASRFIQMDFDNADKLSTVDKRFIVDLLPALPIMLNLLPPIVSECTGRPHDNSRPAMNMLRSIGFEKTDMCDVFDGGPAVRCKTDKTWISRTTTEIVSYGDVSDQDRALYFCGEGLNFRASVGPANTLKKIGDERIAANVSNGTDPVFIAQMKEPQITRNQTAKKETS